MIDWSLIDYHTFEKMAVEYVNYRFDDFHWEWTPQSNDGNRDGVFETRFVSLNITKQGWCEAKYSRKESGSIPKSHLDSTLVSGCLEHPIIIVFVTNRTIDDAYRLRARQLLHQYGIDVEFIEGDELEDWLVNNPVIYEKHFLRSFVPALAKSAWKTQIEDLAFIDWAPYDGSHSAVRETLEAGEQYELLICMKASASAKCIVAIEPQAFIIEQREPLSLQRGRCTLTVRCRANKPYRGNATIGVLDIDGERICSTSISVNVIERPEQLRVAFRAQTDILREVSDHLNLCATRNTVTTLSAPGGFGKSYLLSGVVSEALSGGQHQIVVQRFTDSDAENSSELCKLILHLNFGPVYSFSISAFNNLAERSANIPLETYQHLYKGASSVASSESAIDELAEILRQPGGVSVLPPDGFSGNQLCYIILDDIHKLAGNQAFVMSFILNGFASRSHFQHIICAYRPDEFCCEDLANVLVANRQYEWTIGNITQDDVYETFYRETQSKALADLTCEFEPPLNILHLSRIIRCLRQKARSCKTREEKILAVGYAYSAINMRGDHYLEVTLTDFLNDPSAQLAYLSQNGISFKFFEDFCKSNSIDYAALFDQSVARIDGDLVKPFHDTFYHVFHEMVNRKRVIKTYHDALAFARANGFGEEATLLLIKISELSNWMTPNQKRDAINLCDSLYSGSCFSEARLLASSLIKWADTSKRVVLNGDDAHILYLLAQSTKFSKGYLESNQLWELLKASLENQRTGTSGAIYYEAISELLNNYLWLADFDQAEKCLTLLEDIHAGCDDSLHMQNAYLNSLNRKMLYDGFCSEEPDESLYQVALEESRRLNRLDYAAYAMMDRAKIIMKDNPDKALRLFSDALPALQNDEAHRRRKLDCETEIAFLGTVLNRASLEDLESLRQAALEANYIHTYIKTELKIISVGLTADDDALLSANEKRLDRLLLHCPQIRNNGRECQLYLQARFLLASRRADDDHTLLKAYKELEASYAQMPSFLHVVTSNSGLPARTQIEWCFGAPNKSAISLDPRIW